MTRTPEGVAKQLRSKAPALWLARLSLSHFRNYTAATLDLDSRPVLLTGPNGAGKTNLLEAISLLAPGRGLRRAKAQELQGLGAEVAWAVAARVEGAEGSHQIGTGRDPGGSERRAIRIDGRSEKSQSALGEILDVVWLTPQMDGLWREGASERRRFLDRLVFAFDPAHAGRVSGYESSLRQRSKLLQEGRADPHWLSALEEGLAERGVAIAAARRSLVTRLSRAILGETEQGKADSGFPRCGLSLEGDLDRWLEEGSALAAEERLRAALHDSRERDAQLGGAAVGPHRSDLAARHLEKDAPAGLCSTGEQKALLIGLVLAHARLIAIERGRPPLLLLDEVAAHLDATRRETLYSEILSLGLQAWLTGTEPAVFDPLVGAAQAFAVAEGLVGLEGNE